MMDAALIERIHGVRIATGADRSFLMDDPSRVYLVEQGHLDVFAVELSGSEAIGRRRFIARVPGGEMAFGHRRVRRRTSPRASLVFWPCRHWTPS